jgi:hypothetical protein
LTKLGVNGRVAAALLALQRGIMHFRIASLQAREFIVAGDKGDKLRIA